MDHMFQVTRMLIKQSFVGLIAAAGLASAGCSYRSHKGSWGLDVYSEGYCHGKSQRLYGGTLEHGKCSKCEPLSKDVSRSVNSFVAQFPHNYLFFLSYKDCAVDHWLGMHCQSKLWATLTRLLVQGGDKQIWNETKNYDNHIQYADHYHVCNGVLKA
ncbi:hypothetical protein BV22DRAFT_271162 [Leucogyrophana mollusca]|uniref:Uncharacterized protein n=1 Tax=Leucogyrophana mollusca TaxID=85980 RepID=A0ACB8BSC7_9AGAM|nr:hypothetical protein BV22DRAFT_271162 [Leucogyrophana mollusca]